MDRPYARSRCDMRCDADEAAVVLQSERDRHDVEPIQIHLLNADENRNDALFGIDLKVNDSGDYPSCTLVSMQLLRPLSQHMLYDRIIELYGII
jgi:hypothetical protein